MGAYYVMYCQFSYFGINIYYYLPHLSNAGSFLRFQRVLSAYLSILSEASMEKTSNPSSSNIIESTLQITNTFIIIYVSCMIMIDIRSSH